jgi:hypothetical protein
MNKIYKMTLIIEDKDTGKKDFIIEDFYVDARELQIQMHSNPKFEYLSGKMEPVDVVLGPRHITIIAKEYGI